VTTLARVVNHDLERIGWTADVITKAQSQMENVQPDHTNSGSAGGGEMRWCRNIGMKACRYPVLLVAL
jgi:hypothetical protein